MTAPADAAGMAELIARLGLAEEHVVKDLLLELDDKKAPAEPLVRLMERRGLLTPFQGNKLLKGETDGYFLGGYRILYRIASGTFGKVYRGDDPRSAQIVAIKVLRKKWLEDDSRDHRIASFEREGRIGLTLQHPNIVQILAVGKEPNTDAHFIVMEFVEGGNIRDILTIRKKLPLADALRIMEECAAGLAHAYEKGLTHRDVKPSNILLGTDRVAKLVDFGLAENNPLPNQAPAGPSGGKKVLKGQRKEEEPAERTLDYAGLEKATGVKSGDIRSDIYFLGHCLFEMIAGVPLMERTKNARAAIDRRRFELVEPTFARLADEHNLPDAVRALVAKAIALEPHRRFQTPEQFLEAIQATRAELAASPPAPTPAPPAATPPPAAAPSANGAATPDGPPTIIVVESNAKLQEVFRDRLARLGLRVLQTPTPGPAVKRYAQKPVHAVLFDVGTVGPDAAAAFREVLAAAKAGNHKLAAVLMLNEDQAADAAEFAADPRVGVLVRPVTMKQLADKLTELMPDLPTPPVGASGAVPTSAATRDPKAG